jgi:hypothetical protein
MHQTHRWNSAAASSCMTSGLYIMPSNMAALENGEGSDWIGPARPIAITAGACNHTTVT